MYGCRGAASTSEGAPSSLIALQLLISQLLRRFRGRDVAAQRAAVEEPLAVPGVDAVVVVAKDVLAGGPAELAVNLRARPVGPEVEVDDRVAVPERASASPAARRSSRRTATA